MAYKGTIFIIVAVVVFTLVHTLIFVSDLSGTTGAAHEGFVDENLVAISEPDDYGFVTITGSANAVEPNSKVVVTNLNNNNLVYTYAEDDGSFKTDMLASGMDYLRIEIE